MKKVRLGVIGLGARGKFILRDTLFPMFKDGLIEIVALCDYYEDRVEENVKYVEETIGCKPFGTTDYKEVLKQEIDAIILMTAWESHVEIATAAMRAGIYVGMEVGGSYSIEDCYRLVRTYEETGIH